MASKLSFTLETFDGPLDLLLTLISKQKINIYDIPIALILDQYLDYMEMCQQYDAELSSEFIVMACELVYIKSKMLLPAEEEEEDPRADLVRSLIEYSEVKKAALFLSEQEKKFYHRYGPTPKDPVITAEVPPSDAAILWDAFQDLQTSIREEREKRKKADVESIFSQRVAPVESKVVFVLRRMVRAFPLGNSVSFKSMIREQGEKSDMVATFLAILQLIQSGRLHFEHKDDDYLISLNPKKEREA